MKAIARRPRVWDAGVFTDRYLPGELTDWPAEVQDHVYAAMEEVIQRTGIRELEIIQSKCVRDGDQFYLRLTIMEKLGPQDVRIIH
jgi:hypothetical protein